MLLTATSRRRKISTVRRVCIVACSILLAADAAVGQTPGPTLSQYREAIVTFRRGDFRTAAAAVTNWPPRDLKRLALSIADADEWLRSETAAVFHTEVAIQCVASGQDQVAGLHLDIAEGIVQALLQRERQRASMRVSINGGARVPLPPAIVVDIAEFQRRWYAFAASLILARTAPAPALPLIERGLHLFKNDAQLRMLVGASEEMNAHIDNGNLHDRTAIMTARDPGWTRLTFAEDSYRRATALDHGLAEAHLRLGRVLSLKKELQKARAELEPIGNSTAEPRIRYLAHLFLGAVNDFERDTAGARREYEAALALAPQYQTAYVALGFVESMSGHDARARELAARLAGLTPTPEGDPWWSYQNGGLDFDSLKWLRARIVR